MSALSRIGTTALLATALSLGTPLLSGCVGDGSTGDELVAGTGSSGGNPASIGFALTARSGDGGVSWERARVTADDVLFARLDERGDCSFDADDRRPGGLVLGFDAEDRVEIDVTRLCRIALLPADELPLFELRGRMPLRQLIVRLFLREGVDLVLDERIDTLDTERVIVVALDPVALLASIDLESLERSGDGVELSDVHEGLSEDQRAQLRASLLSAMALYLDPTPETPGLTLAERTDENRIGHIELASE